ncbi:MAG TPA: FKBP-type peptidyl-prolyl cis-trans isomerase [Candidatus Saccharibacteria bacterium]|nr:FKBP-type peptidyl-prolyl cis-trans isomerase [Candidatus Saccharibacteria bacterium]
MSKKVTRISALVLAVLFLVSSLGFTGIVIWQMTQQDNQKEEPVDQAQTDPNALTGKPLADFETVKSVDKLVITDISQGNGKEAKVGSNITVHYTGANATTGIVFQSSKDVNQPIPLDLIKGQVIQGWVDGVPGMKVGGVRRILIPSELAYGEEGNSGIPPNTPLVFDIELIAVK